MSIDWSKAPEWATHHGYVGIGMCEVWLNDCQYTYVDGKQGGRVFFFAAKEGWEVDEIINVSPRPGMPKWTGEGLPPVGTACEYSLAGQSWYPCEIRYVLDNNPDPEADGWQAVIWCPHLGKEQVARVEPAGHFQFRPIRTPEQIAAEEREKSVVEMEQLIAGATTWQEALRRIYDAGYRKVEGGAQ